MRTVGIIAEYNPLHTGHEYHLKKAKELAGAAYAVVVMSPDYVQRGEPAIFDKYTRTRMALYAGADLVLELPVCYASGSAEYFAQGAVALLEKLGVVDALCFGAETGDAALFCETAKLLHQEPTPYRQKLKELLAEGQTYPQARSKALLWYLDSQKTARTSSCSQTTAEFLAAPNNILGIEYCKALIALKSRMRPLPLPRMGNSFGSTALDGLFCSATAIRNGMLTGSSRQRLLHYTPDACRELFLSAAETPVTSEELLPFLVQKFLSHCTFSDIQDISPDLSDRICRLRYSCVGKTYEEIVTLLKTKQITESHIRRALLHLVLGISSDSVKAFRENGTVFYARVLGLRKDSSPLLRKIRENTGLPLLTKTAGAAEAMAQPALQMWQQDLYAAHLYRSAASLRYKLPFQTEYEHSPIVI